jgi:alkanesulfonate monooxygenase SsuD/methylene tetrahydromethanopterin reductase-like flavin-dependent oxidoreductase (luciferase family)
MRFGLFFLLQRDPAWSDEAVYESELAQMLAAEALGYDSVWIAEHHFADYGICPAPPVLAAAVAARTTTLRLGMGVSLLPLHHPVDLAEQLAVLDQVSGGRLDVGIGRGGTLLDYRTFGAERDDSRARMEEGITIMRGCWRGEPFSFAGRFHAVEDVHLRPHPRQRPHPPLFIAANSEESVRTAARLGLPTLSSFFVPAAELARRHALYRDEALAGGLSAETVTDLQRRSWGMRVVVAGRDRDEVLTACEAPFMGYQARLAGLRSAEQGGGLPDSFDRSLVRLRPFTEYLDAGLALIGTVDNVVEGLSRYAEQTGYERILLLTALPGLDTDVALRSMELFAERVMPRFAGLGVA